MTKIAEHAALAAEAGFSAAASEAQKVADCARRMALAYEHYRYVTPGQIEKFNERLKAQTLKRTGRERVDLHEHYDVLAFTPVEKYKDLPPADVLAKVKDAKDKKIFDTLEVCKVESKVEYKDPIVFGRIEGCGDRFYIAQWDNDVKIEDLLGPNEG